MDKITSRNKKRAEQLNIQDPNQWIWVEHPKHADWIKKATVLDFIKAAEKQGIDPYYFLGMGMAESHLGSLHEMNPVRVDWGVHGKALENLGITEQNTPREDVRLGLIDFAARLMRENFNKYKDPITALQAYSGTGKTIYSGDPAKVKELYGTTKMFGKDFRNIDFWKEKPQGKMAFELANLLKDNVAIQEIINNPQMRFKIDTYLMKNQFENKEKEEVGEPSSLLKQLEVQ